MNKAKRVFVYAEETPVRRDVLGLNGVSSALTFTWSLSFPRLKGQLPLATT